MTQLAGKVVWITGASSGIGEGLAAQAAQRGACRAKKSGVICRAMVCSAPLRAATLQRIPHNNF